MLQKAAINQRFPRLFTPGYIGNLWVKNRLIHPPMCRRYANSDGCVTERLVNHYREVARGGVGLVIVGFAHVDEKASRTIECELNISRDDFLSGLDWLAATIKDNGARACQQIAHAGIVRIDGGQQKAASRTLPLYPFMPVPEELTIAEIKEIVEAFGNAALRVKTAGFDMVEVHGAHGYLVTDFLSPHLNKRADAYGGSLTNRMRFLLELVNNIRQKVGPDYPLSVRLSGSSNRPDEPIPEEPVTIEETGEVARALEKAGVNIINVSGAGHLAAQGGITMYYPRAADVWAAERIKQVVSVPVITVGSITSPELAEEILAEGKADFIALGRPLLADPQFPLKAKGGRPEDIRPCIRCVDGCLDRGIYMGSVK